MSYTRLAKSTTHTVWNGNHICMSATAKLKVLSVITVSKTFDDLFCFTLKDLSYGNQKYCYVNKAYLTSVVHLIPMLSTPLFEDLPYH